MKPPFDPLNKIKNVNLPHGSALEWDITKLTDDQLEYERILAWEALYGSYVDGKLALDGLYKSREIELARNSYVVGIDGAINVWQKRLKRAEDEIVERSLLGF